MADVEDDMEAVLPRLAQAVTPVLRETGAGERVLRPEAEAQFALMRRCQAGEAGAFEELVKLHQPRVASVIRGILRNSNDCEDLAQQVFTKVYFALDKFNYQSAVGTWIYKIAVNECLDHLRKQKVRKASILADLSEEEAAWIENHDVMGAAGIARLDRQVEVKELAHKLLARLESADRTLLILKEVEGYSVHEIAEIMGMNENTVKVRLFRARQALVTAWKRKRV